MRATWLEINLDALAHNLRTLRARLQPGTGIIAVIKADAYGHGAVPIAHELARLGVERFAVATVEEGARLRQARIRHPVHLLGSLHPEEAAPALAHALIPTLSTLEAARAVAAHRPGATVHVKADSGMGRVGVPLEALRRFVEEVEAMGLEVEGVFTHFASADEDPAATRRQLEAFLAVTAPWQGRYKLHAANSAAALRFPEAHLDFVRPGIALYGLPPGEGFAREGLRPILAWKAHPTLVKRVRPGQRIGYGGTYTAQREEWIATLPLGYADGFPRALSNRGWVRLGRAYCPVVGRVSMDQITVRLPGPVGYDAVFEVITPDLDARTSLTGRAAQLGTIPYELATLLSPRLPRVYLHAAPPTQA